MGNLFYILYNMAEIINYLLGYEVLFHIRLKNKPVMIGAVIVGNVILHGFIANGNEKISPGEVNFLYGMIIPLILLSGSKIKAILVYFDVVMITSLINTCLSYALSLWLEVPQIALGRDYAKAFICNMLFLILAVSVLIKQSKGKGNTFEFPEFTIPQYIMITAGVFSTVIIIAVLQRISEMGELGVQEQNLYGLCVTGAFIVFGSVMVRLSYSVKRNSAYEKQQEIMSLYMERQENYISHVIQKDEEMRRFRHDIRGHINVLQYCINSGDIAKAREYVNEISDVITNGNLKKYTGISAVDAMINDMEKRIKDKNITLEWKGSIQEYKEIKVFDMCTLFVNLMNNAIEACEKLPDEKKILINTYVYEGKIYISEENAYVGEINIGKDGMPETAKTDKKNHGIGSKNIKSVVEKYNGKVVYTVGNGQFKIEILI